METKVGTVEVVDRPGHSGIFRENGTNKLINFEIIHVGAYVTPGTAVKVVSRTAAGRYLYTDWYWWPWRWPFYKVYKWYWRPFRYFFWWWPGWRRTTIVIEINHEKVQEGAND